MSFKWNAITSQLDLIGARILTTYSGDPNSSISAEVTGAEVGVFMQQADDRNKLWIKTSSINVWVLIDTSEAAEVPGAPAITSVSESLAFTWMGFGQ